MFTCKSKQLLRLFRKNKSIKESYDLIWVELVLTFTPLPWRNSRAPRQNSLWADLVTLAWFGLLRHSWPLRLPLWLALCCLFQHIHQHVWLSLIIERYEMSDCFWSRAVCTNMERGTLWGQFYTGTTHGIPMYGKELIYWQTIWCSDFQLLNIGPFLFDLHRPKNPLVSIQ